VIEIDWKPDERTLRKFGISMLILCSVFSAVLFFRNHAIAAGIFIGLAAYCGITLLVFKRALRPLYGFWMAIAWLLGKIISPLVLGLIYYGVITPIGLALRLTGHDKLQLKKPAGPSYWHDIPQRTDTDGKGFERQF
jgi:carbamoyltransferase